MTNWLSSILKQLSADETILKQLYFILNENVAQYAVYCNNILFSINLWFKNMQNSRRPCKCDTFCHKCWATIVDWLEFFWNNLFIVYLDKKNNKNTDRDKRSKESIMWRNEFKDAAWQISGTNKLKFRSILTEALSSWDTKTMTWWNEIADSDLSPKCSFGWFAAKCFQNARMNC